MKQFNTKYTLLAAGLLAWAGLPLMVLPGYAQSKTDRQGAQAGAHAHSENESSQGHTRAEKRHGKTSGDAHGDDDDHAHEHGDEHGHGHEEVKTQISPESAKRMGIVVAKAGPALIDQTVPLAGRITLNENTQAKVPARFPGIVRSVKANLGEYVKEGQVLAVVEANESMRDYEVIAPISGYVLARNTNLGDVANGDPLFVIADLSDVWAKFHVFPRDADVVRNGQDIEVQTFHGDKSQKGKIDMFFPLADDISQTQIAISILPNPNGAWKPGMAVVSEVTVTQTGAPIAVRQGALQKMEELGDVVFVQEGDAYEARPVKLGASGGGYVEITDGLKAGESYVAESSFIIKSDILKATAAHSH